MLKKFYELFRKKDAQKGQGIVEYVLLLGVVTVIAAGLIDNSTLQASLGRVIKYVKEILLNSGL